MADLLQGWQAPTLRRVDGQWRIYCHSSVAFVPLDKATDELVASCPGATERREADDNESF